MEVVYFEVCVLGVGCGYVFGIDFEYLSFG